MGNYRIVSGLDQLLYLFLERFAANVKHTRPDFFAVVVPDFVPESTSVLERVGFGSDTQIEVEIFVAGIKLGPGDGHAGVGFEVFREVGPVTPHAFGEL